MTVYVSTRETRHCGGRPVMEELEEVEQEDDDNDDDGESCVFIIALRVCEAVTGAAVRGEI